MRYNNALFYSSLGISVAGHVLVIVALSATTGNILVRPVRRQLEVTYSEIKTKTAVKPQDFGKDLKVTKQDAPQKNVKVLAERTDMFSEVGTNIKEVSRYSRAVGEGEKQTAAIAPLDARHKVTIPVFKSEKITNPKYLGYNHQMSRAIKHLAASLIDQSQFEVGKVYLTFRLSSNGVLRGIKIIEEKTRANNHLRDVALRSVTESSPFPPFPADLNYPELTFNVLISFEDMGEEAGQGS